ncbi:MAG: ral secretion pathway protein [Patescibacteria group bacterium]|nr:ral secretion pathway protein [Patescibacteria group bacterium]
MKKCDLVKCLKKHNKKVQKFFSGFTLIELLVVIAIIGILATVVMISLSAAREKVRDAKRKQDVKQVDTAISLYMDDHDGSPPDLGDSNCVNLSSSDINCIASSETNPANWTILETQLQPYISELPSDSCVNCSETVTFEYIYHAPAGVNASLDPVVPDFSGKTYSIFASALESNEEESFGYGPSVPASEGAPAAPVASVDLVANPDPALRTTTWTSSNVTSCTATGGDPDAVWAGAKSTSGSYVTPAYLMGATVTYILTCTGDYGPASDSITFVVGGGGMLVAPSDP